MQSRSSSRGSLVVEPVTEHIACSLSADGLGDRLASFRAVLARGLVHAERLDGAVRWRFDAAQVSFDELAELAQQEHACCPFFGFTLQAFDGEIEWVTQAPHGAEPFLDALFAIRESLRRT